MIRTIVNLTAMRKSTSQPTCLHGRPQGTAPTRTTRDRPYEMFVRKRPSFRQKPESRGEGITPSPRAPFVLLPRRSRSYSAWHISPVNRGNPAAFPLGIPCVLLSFSWAPRPLSQSERGRSGSDGFIAVRAI